MQLGFRTCPVLFIAQVFQDCILQLGAVVDLKLVIRS